MDRSHNIIERFKRITVESSCPVMDVATGKIHDRWTIRRDLFEGKEDRLLLLQFPVAADLFQSGTQERMIEEYREWLNATYQPDKVDSHAKNLTDNVNGEWFCRQKDIGTTLELLKARCEQETTTDIIQHCIDRNTRPITCWEAIKDANEFEGDIGQRHLGEMLYAIDPKGYRRCFTEKAAHHFCLDTKSDTARHIAQLDQEGHITVDARCLATVPEQAIVFFANKLKRHSGILRLKSVYPLSRSIHAKCMDPEAAQKRFHSIVEAIQPPDESQANSALECLLAGLDRVTVVLVDAREHASFSGVFIAGSAFYSSHATMPCINIASKRSTADNLDALLEEAGHSIVDAMYGNDCKPYLKEGDARKGMLEQAIRRDVTGFLQKWRLRISSYSTDEYSIEAPVKILKAMAQGKWTERDKGNFPHLDAYIRNVVWADFAHYQEHGKVPDQPAMLPHRVGLSLERRMRKAAPPAIATVALMGMSTAPLADGTVPKTSDEYSSEYATRQVMKGWRGQLDKPDALLSAKYDRER